MVDQTTLSKLLANAKDQMQSNLEKVDGKLFVMPSKALYPAAWGWDTPQIAAGLYADAPDDALSLMEDYLSFQWDNGMIPHIVFPTLAQGEQFDADTYFPSPPVWYAEGNHIRDYAQMDAKEFENNPAYIASNGQTTAISQYPIWAINLKAMQDETSIAQERLADLVEKIDASHRYFYEECDPEGLGLAAELHPWIGCDNAPAYDKAMHRIAETATDEELALAKAQRADVKRVVVAGGDPSERPTDEDYVAFLKICHGVGEAAAKYAKGEAVGTDDLPFVIYSPMLNGMLLRAEEDLVELAQACGKQDVAKQATQRAEKMREAMMEHLWDASENRFAYYDAKTNEKECVSFVGELIPLMDPKLPKEARQQLEKRLNENYIGDYHTPIPTTLRDNPERVTGKEGYDACYWRGPMWLNLTEMLRPYADDPTALRDQCLDTIRREGFREYFDAETGEGLGSDHFGWTAAYTSHMAREALKEIHAGHHSERVIENRLTQTAIERG